MLIFYLSLIENEADKIIFEDLYYKYKDDVMRRTTYIMHNEHDGEDMAQETWTYIAKHFSKLDMRDFTVFRSYIMTVAKHLCIDALRKHKIEVLEEELTAEEIDGCTAIDEDCVFREVCAKDASQILMQCLSELREEYRDVLKLHYYHGRKVREIAEVLHLSESNVKQRLARGRVLLAEKIKEKGMVYEEL